MASILLQIVIYLLAAVIAVPIAKRLGLGSVLGYLIAGVMIGPVIGLVGAEAEDIQHFAEFGVVMMLFLVGLELEPRKLWDLRARLLGLGGLQVSITTLAIAAIAIGLGQSWNVALAVGMVFALSSTAIVLQTLTEKGLLKSEGGQGSFSVLLFQDIAVIPMLVLIPLLAMPEFAVPELAGIGGEIAGAKEGGKALSLTDGLPGWAVALVTLGAVAAVVLGGHYLSRPLFRFIAAARLREIFTAAALLMVVAIALLMTLVGLSPALGTFLAGVVLANSEFRHELESDIEPFKGLLLGLFFITVGAGIDFAVLAEAPLYIASLTLGVIALKAAVLFGLAKLFKMPGREGWLLALGLAQAGEFAFVLLSFSIQNNVISPELSKTLALVVALSMLLTPLLFILYDKVIAPRMAASESRDTDAIPETGSVIVAGHGRFGQIVNRMLLANGFKTVVLDHRGDLVDGMRRFGVRSFYGDASRPELLAAAGLEEARTLIVAIDDPSRAVDIVRHARRERPGLHIIARAFDRQHVYALYQAGADDIVRETFDSAVRVGKYALTGLGLHPYRVEKLAGAFVKHDRQTVAELARVWDPKLDVFENTDYIALAKARRELFEDAVRGMQKEFHDRTERGWTPPPRGYADELEEEEGS